MAIESLDRLLTRIENGVMVTTILASLMLGATQVILRYVFNTGIIWIEPIVVNLTLLGAMMGGARAVTLHAHVRVGVLIDWLPHSIRRWFHLLAALLSFAYCGFVFFIGWLFVKFLYDADILALQTGLPSWIEYSTTLVAMAFFMIRYLQLLPGIWRGELREPGVVD